MLIRRRTLPLLFAGASGIAALAACTLDVNKYSLAPEELPDAGSQTDGSTDGNVQQPDASVAFADLRLEAVQQAPHNAERFELRVISSQDRTVGKAVVDKTIGAARPIDTNFPLFMRAFIPNGAGYRLDFWFDHGAKVNGVYDPPAVTSDHSWRRIIGDPLPTGVTYRAPTYTVYFVHDQGWTDLNQDPAGQRIDFNATSFGAFELNVLNSDDTKGYTGKMFELRVIASATGQTVGLYRKTQMALNVDGEATPANRMQITDILDSSTTYQVNAFVDVNGDAIFNRGSEPSWSFPIGSDSDGAFTGTLNLNSTQVEIDNGNSNLPVLDDAGVPVGH